MFGNDLVLDFHDLLRELINNVAPPLFTVLEGVEEISVDEDAMVAVLEERRVSPLGNEYAERGQINFFARYAILLEDDERLLEDLRRGVLERVQMLVEERTSWIDQVLLEIKTQQIIYDEDSTHVTVVADVQLELLIGTTDLVQSRSLMMLFYERDQAGNYILVEEREALALNPDTMLPYRELTVGELRADVLEDRGGN